MKTNAFFNHLLGLLKQIGDYNKPPNIWVVLGFTVVIAFLVWYNPVWRRLRHAITIIHESGHAFIAVCTGRPLGGIRLHMDTSGTTTTYGDEGGFGRILTSLAGYPAASVLGLIMAWVIGLGYAVATLWGLIVILILVLLYIRNFFGLVTVLITFAVVSVATWFLPSYLQVMLATLVMLFFLLGGLKTGLELYTTWVRDRVRETDADTLAHIALLPAPIWILLFIAVDAACIIGSIILLFFTHH